MPETDNFKKKLDFIQNLVSLIKKSETYREYVIFPKTSDLVR